MNIVFYHANCLDGFAAAYAAWLFLDRDNTIFREVSYGDAVPDCVDAEADVYVLDFSWSAGELLALRAKCRSLTVIDHHKTAIAALDAVAQSSDINVVFDLQHSGCVLAWQYFCSNRVHVGITIEMPESYKYIEHRDLGRMWDDAWNHAIPGGNTVCRELCFGLAYGLPRAFSAWLKDVSRTDLLLQRGAYIQAAMDDMVQALVRNAYQVHLGVRDGQPLWVPAVNTSALHSETGNALLKLYPQAPFACTWFASVRTTPVGPQVIYRYSLRSRRALRPVDVSNIAAAYGGGGHENAAGFESSVLLPSRSL